MMMTVSDIVSQLITAHEKGNDVNLNKLVPDICKCTHLRMLFHNLFVQPLSQLLFSLVMQHCLVSLYMDTSYS